MPGGSIVSLPGALHYKDVPLISYTSASNEPQIYFQSFNSDETLLYYPNSCVFKFPDTWESAYNVEAIYAPGNPYLYGLPSSWKGLHRCQSINLSNCVTTMRGGYAAMPASWEGLDALTGRYAFAGASGEVIVNSSFAGMSYVFTGGTEGYEHLANLEHAAGLFNGCSSWALDASGLYQYLSTKEKPVLDHIGCFSGCSSADGLDQVPADWK